jgi:hypothetical protein
VAKTPPHARLASWILWDGGKKAIPMVQHSIKRKKVNRVVWTDTLEEKWNPMATTPREGPF